MDVSCLFDTPNMYKSFLREVDALPENLQQVLARWHARLTLEKVDVCTFTLEAKQAYERYKEDLCDLREHHLSANAQKNGLAQMYVSLEQDALLVAALNASLKHQVDGPAVITIHIWAMAQEFAEWLRERYHQFTAEERKKALFLSTTAAQPHLGRVTIQGHDLPAIPFFFYSEIVVQTDEPKFHWVRLLTQRAYYAK